jgi:conjugal transfer/entry exclusion protein
MPIKWSALRVSEAMDMAEEFVNQAAEPLEQAKIVANEARNIANLPQYLDQRLTRLIIDIERIDYIKSSIEAVRRDLPDGAIEAEKKSESHGRQPALVS